MTPRTYQKVGLIILGEPISVIAPLASSFRTRSAFSCSNGGRRSLYAGRSKENLVWSQYRINYHSKLVWVREKTTGYEVSGSSRERFCYPRS